MRHDGSPDFIACGRGRNDFVQYRGAFESHDTFRGCETVARYWQ